MIPASETVIDTQPTPTKGKTDSDPPEGSPPGPETGRVSLVEKVAFAIGGISTSITGDASNSLVNPVFVLGFGISPAVVSMLGVVYRFVDAIFDMMMGLVSDRTRSRWGRRRPYIFVGVILYALWMPVIWLFGRNWSVSVITVWMAVSILVAYLFSSVCNIPYQCMLLEMTPDSKERTNVAAFRGYFGWVAYILMAWSWRIIQLPIFNNAAGKPDILTGARWLSVGMGVIVIGLGVLPAIFGRERYYKAAVKEGQVSFLQNFKLTFACKPFMLLSLYSLLLFIGTNLNIGLAFYTRLAYVCQGDQKLASNLSGIEGTLCMIISLLGFPIFQWVANHHGKRFALIIVMIIMFFASVSTFVTYNPAHPYLSMLSGMLLAPANAALWMLIPSMLGDIVDHDELQNNERREGAFAAIYSWIYKVAVSVGMGFSGPLVVWAGFNAQPGASQSEHVLFLMRIFIVVIPAFCIMASILVLSRYPLTTGRVEEIRLELEARRGSV